jgi:23S rRNA (uracil1939-C5)-methyltransferase
MDRGDEIIVKIDSLAFEGKSVARHEGKVIFVEGAVPGDMVKCEIKRSKKSYSDAKVTEIFEKSPLRVEPKCKYFGLCGGCKWQNLSYEAQLRFKHQNVVDAFERIGGLKGINVLPVIGSVREYFYRNKMELTFSRQRWLTTDEINKPEELKSEIGLGLHIPNRYEKVLDINECWLQSEVSSKIINSVREFSKTKNLTVYSTKTHDGYLRHVMMRTSDATGEIMVNVVTTHDKPEIMNEMSSFLVAQNPEITTVVNNITDRKSMVAFGEKEVVYYGTGYITEKLGNYSFHISANSFFQTNTKQAERLYSVVKEFAGLQGNEIVYDLYSGIGSIAIYLSDSASRIIGIELIGSAIDDAMRNAEFNGVKNCEFILGDLKDKLTKDISWATKSSNPDLVILDPPRSGLHPKVVEEIIKINPRRIVYVSCNPSTQARDAKMFVERRYVLEFCQPVDMFPHTFHIENVALLKK